MQQAVVVIGQGEMGGVFSRAFLRCGYPVVPVTRQSHLPEIEQQWPHPALVVVAVNEKGFVEAMQSIPQSWRNKLLLIQNELLPKDWLAFDSTLRPTVISVWFEKKPGQDVKVIIPSPVHGDNASVLADALASIKIPCRILTNEEQLLYQLVLKNVYILTSNIAGLKYGGTVGELWSKHADFTRRLCDEVVDIQNRLADSHFSSAQLLTDMLAAFDGDSDHRCQGRSAAQRLSTALIYADQFAIAAPTLREVERLSREE